MSGLMQTLLEVHSAKDLQSRNAATAMLASAQRANPAQFLYEMAAILHSEAPPKLARTMAGLSIKNTLKNATGEETLKDVWARVDPALKGQIRSNALATLACTDKDIRQSAAQAVAAIASIDLPTDSWPNILSVLVQNAHNTHHSYKQASLLTLGFICEDLVPGTVSKAQSDQILTAIAGNLAPAEENVYIKLDALKALNNILRFAEANFHNPPERDYLVELVCECAQHRDLNIQLHSFQVLCDIGALYYEEIAPNMPLIWQVTSTAIREGEQTISILAVEFWNTLADIERQRDGGLHYLEKATPVLLPLLLTAIVRFPRQDEEDWTLRKASASCISSCAFLAGDKAVEPCLSFIAQHINSPDLYFVLTAILVFGSILDGPSSAVLKPAIIGGIETMLRMMTSQHFKIRENAAWALGHICELHYPILRQSEHMGTLITVLVRGLSDEPKIAVQIAWCCLALVSNPSREYILTPQQYKQILEGLIRLLRTTNSDVFRDVQITTYTTLCSVIERAPESCVQLIENEIPHFLSELQTDLSENSLRNVLAVFESICHRLPDNMILADNINRIVSSILAQFNQRKSVLDEGVAAIGALAHRVGPRMSEELGRVMPFLLYAVECRNETALCKAGTQALGDFALAIAPHAEKYARDVVMRLVTNLEHSSIAAEIKVFTVMSLAELLSTSTAAFLPYLPTVLKLIDQAADASLQDLSTLSPEMRDYMVSLRDAILEFYTGLLQGLAEIKAEDVLRASAGKITTFAVLSVQGNFQSPDMMQLNAMILLEELLVAYQHSVFQHIPEREVLDFVCSRTASPSEKVREQARTLQEVVRDMA